jgi:hypothetical protein
MRAVGSRYLGTVGVRDSGDPGGKVVPGTTHPRLGVSCCGRPQAPGKCIRMACGIGNGAQRVREKSEFLVLAARRNYSFESSTGRLTVAQIDLGSTALGAQERHLSSERSSVCSA